MKLEPLIEEMREYYNALHNSREYINDDMVYGAKMALGIMIERLESRRPAMTKIALLDIQKADRPTFEASHKFVTEVLDKTNDTHYEWVVGEALSESFGFDQEQANLISHFCLDMGAELGERVLIKHWW